MKPSFLLLLLTLPALAIHPRHTYTTARELQGFGDFNGDGRHDVVVIDRAAGLHRIGLAQPDGSLVWQPPKPTGCPAAEALAVGRVTTTSADQIILTGRSANQIFILDPASAYNRPFTLTPAGIGPAAVAAVDINLPGNDPALHDLACGTASNSAPSENQLHLVQSTPGSLTPALTVSSGATRLERLSRVQLDTANPEILLTLHRDATDELRITNTSTVALPILASLTALAPGTDFVHAPFIPINPRSQFVLFVPGTPGLHVSAWNGTTLVSPAARNPGPDPVLAVNLTDDGTRLGIAVIFNDGTHASLFHFNGSGNLVPVGTLTPPPGEKLNGILCHAPSHLAALSGPPGGTSTTTTPHTHDGSGWVAGTPESLAPPAAAVARANVFVYDKEPLVNDDAKLVETFQVPDWSSTFSISGGSTAGINLTVETFSGQAGGLGNPAATSVPGLPPAGAASRALVNQNQPEVAISSASGTLGIVPVQIAIDPPPGTYARYIAPQLVVPDATGITAHYRTSLADPWASYTFGTPIPPPGDTLTPFTIWYYAEDTVSGRRSPVHQADYAFAGAPGELDSDGDGVPDFVEIQLGLDPLGGPDSDDDGLTDLEEILLGSDPANGTETATYGTDVLDLPPSRTADQDGDGFSDFAEWAAGSNPFDPASTPTADALVEYRNTLDLNIRPLSHSGNPSTAPNRQSFRVGHPTFSPTEVRVHDLGGRLLAAAPTRSHAAAAMPNPYAALPGIPATGRDLFVLVSTPATFDCVTDDATPGTGRELIGLVPIPTLDAGPVPFTATPASTAADWIAAAQAHYASLPRETLSAPLDLHDSLIYLLWERIAGEKLTARGILTDPLSLGLATFRDTAATPSQSANTNELLSLQSYLDSSDPGILLQPLAAAIRQEIISPSHPSTNALKLLANQFHQLSAAARTDAERALYPSPFETLRTVVRGLPADPSGLDGLIPLPGDDPTDPISYAGGHTLSPAAIAAAEGALIYLLGLVPERPTATFTATVTPATFATRIPVLEDTFSTTGLRLFDANGDPFVFPQSLDLPVGTILNILAFTDRTDLPTGDGTAVETISATIISFPTGTLGDLNQNAIDDAYEDYFFGGPVDPFGDADGDGYINLHEFLAGTHPNNPSSTPGGTPLPDSMPPVRIEIDGDNLVFTLEFPSEYGDRIQFVLQGSGNNLTAPFIESPDAATDAGLNQYTLTIPRPAATRNFFRFRLALHP